VNQKTGTPLANVAGGPDGCGCDHGGAYQLPDRQYPRVNWELMEINASCTKVCITFANLRVMVGGDCSRGSQRTLRERYRPQLIKSQAFIIKHGFYFGARMENGHILSLLHIPAPLPLVLTLNL